MLGSKREGVGLHHYNDSKAFTEYSNNMDDIYENIEENNLIKEREIFIIFDDMVADILSNVKLVPIVTELVNDTNLASEIPLRFRRNIF